MCEGIQVGAPKHLTTTGQRDDNTQHSPAGPISCRVCLLLEEVRACRQAIALHLGKIHNLDTRRLIDSNRFEGNATKQSSQD